MRNEPTIVAVIADTHVNHLNELPPELITTLASADVVIHLGDFTSQELLNDLRKLNNFYGIAGNHDDKLLCQGLKEMEVVEVGGKRLGLFHGFFIPFSTQKRMKALFREHKIDAILYGHTHCATSRSIEGVFLFNPGSVTGYFPANYASFGLLTLDGSISWKIVPLERPYKAGKGFLRQLGAMLLQKAVRWLETWPYPDFPLYVTSTKLALKKSFLDLRKLAFWKKKTQKLFLANSD
jgi:putative phosphoesterase